MANDFVIVAVCDHNFKLFAQNWLESLRMVSLVDKARLVCLDDELFNEIDFKGKVKIPEIIIEKHGDIFQAKLRAAHYFLMQGYNVLISDVDVVFLMNPMDIIMKLSDKYDLVGQDTGERKANVAINAGFYYLKNSEKTKQLTDLSNSRDQVETFGFEDQMLLNYRIIDMGINFITLDKSLFPTGRFLQRTPPAEPYIIHFSCCSRDKTAVMRSHKCWFMSELTDAGIEEGFRRNRLERSRNDLRSRRRKLVRDIKPSSKDGFRRLRRKQRKNKLSVDGRNLRKLPFITEVGAPPLAVLHKAEATKKWHLIVIALQLLDIDLRTYVEIGVNKGSTFKPIFNKYPDASYYLIDPWEIYDGYTESKTSIYPSFSPKLKSQHYNAAYKYMVDNYGNFINVHIVRKQAKDAVADIPDNLDLVFIDGNHEYEYVKQDIELYLPKVRPGGLLCGHDYGLWSSGVKKAVDEVLGDDVQLANDFMWFYHKI